MKNTFKSFLLIALLGFFQACGNDDDTKDPGTKEPELVTSPEATAENNASSAGVYKGVVIGSSGTVKVMLQGGIKSAVVTLDNVTKTLGTNDLKNWAPGQAINNALFSADNWQLRFSVNANGANPQAVVTIPGHAGATISMFKEVSTDLVKAYEGTFSGANSGTWNFMIKGRQVRGIRKGAMDTVAVALSGGMSGDTLMGYTGSASVTGTVTGNNASGTWTDSGTSGTWTGKRTL